MRLGDHGEPERVRHALAVGLAVRGEAKHRLDQRLELERRRDLGDEAQLVLPRVPELVCCAGLDRERLAWAGGDRFVSELEPECPGEDLEALGLVGV
jgi:hypothetical protein